MYIEEKVLLTTNKNNKIEKTYLKNKILKQEVFKNIPPPPLKVKCPINAPLSLSFPELPDR